MMARLAWRNLWRNPRRTGIILVAIVVGVVSMLGMAAFTRGVLDSMIDNGIATLTGHVSIAAPGYRADPVVAHVIADPGTVTAALAAQLPEGSRWATRVRVSGVAQNARHSAGIMLVGIDPAAERDVSFIGDGVVAGEPLAAGDDSGVVIGRAALADFETDIGNKLILLAQGTDGETAARAFRIRGVFRAETEGAEKRFVFVNRAAAQEMLGLGDAVSEVSAVLPGGAAGAAGADAAADAVRLSLGGGVAVSTWRQLLPIVDAYLSMIEGVMIVWYVVVFLAMSFGLVNTILMAVMERMREFGLLTALGMRGRLIIGEVMVEAALLLLLGTALGTLATLATIAWFADGIDLTGASDAAELIGMSRIVVPRVTLYDAALANLVVIVLGLGVSFYPAWRAARFTPVEAMART